MPVGNSFRDHFLRQVKQERQFQLNRIATQQDDLQYKDGELAMAAAVYAVPPDKREALVDFDGAADKDVVWPFSRNMYKKTKRYDELIKAAALLLAEAERLASQAPVERAEKAVSAVTEWINRNANDIRSQIARTSAIPAFGEVRTRLAIAYTNDNLSLVLPLLPDIAGTYRYVSVTVLEVEFSVTRLQQLINQGNANAAEMARRFLDNNVLQEQQEVVPDLARSERPQVLISGRRVGRPMSFDINSFIRSSLNDNDQ